MRQKFSVLTAGIPGGITGKILQNLQEDGYEVAHHSVESGEELRSMFSITEWDLILSTSDSSVIDISSILEFIDATHRDVIFILIGQNTQEDTVINAMENGVHDHVDSHHLYRLYPAVKREIEHLNNRRRHQRSVEQNKLLSHILTKSLNEIYLVDPQNMEFCYANSATLNKLGYEKNEFYWLSPFDIVGEEDVETLRLKYDELISGTTDKVVLEKYRKRKDGTTYPVEIHLELIEQGGSKFILGICFDITKRLEDARELELHKEESRKLALNNKYKSEFIATISHEMRTTLNSVIILSEILSRNKENNLTKEQLDYLDIIQTSNNGLLELLNEVLDLSKIDSGKVDIRLSELELDFFCKRISRLYNPIAREKGLEFNFEIGNGIPDTLYTDRIRLEQVLKNLISNAFKFTPEGSVTVKVYPFSKNQIAFSVTDTGLGITPNALSKIFDSYEQADNSETPLQYTGTGLGLAISKQLTELLGGKIEVSSTIGEGTTFTVTIPVDSSKAVSKQAEIGTLKQVKDSEPDTNNVPEKKKFKKGSVLLIDDSSIHNLALKEFLSVKIEKCITAESSGEAFEVLEKDHSFDCIVLDMYLPDADGKDVVKKLKSNENYKDIPVIIYSGKSLTSAEETELLVHASAIVQKNVKSYKVLLEQIARMIE